MPQQTQPPAARRSRPGIAHDNRFFWDGGKAGKQLIREVEIDLPVEVEFNAVGEELSLPQLHPIN